MKTKEVEHELGIMKQTILFYEKEGLIKPARDDNGYRNYTMRDIQTLKLVKVLRSMDISIEDIKLVLRKEISFQDCLKANEKKLKQTIEALQEMKRMVSSVKEMNLPIIPTLSEIDTQSDAFTIGFSKTNQSASLGRRITKAYVRRLFVYGIVWSIALTVATILGMSKWSSLQLTPIWMSVLVIFIFILILVTGFPSCIYMTHMARNQYIEFIEKGVRYYQYRGCISNIRYMWSVAFGKDETYLRECTYEEIRKVKIEDVKRYMGVPGTNMPIAKKDYDFYFTFENGDTLYLYNPMTFKHDRLLVTAILKEKVKNIEDENQVLDIFGATPPIRE